MLPAVSQGFSGLTTTDRCSFLGVVGMIGAAYEDDHVATGFGNHLARPIFRSEHRPDMTEASRTGSSQRHFLWIKRDTFLLHST